jgi:hypothetical protein
MKFTLCNALMVSFAAPAPFNDPKADIVLRSSDNVDFRMHKVDLCRASPVFETMFSFPQPASAKPLEADTTQESNEQPSVLPVAESEEQLPVVQLAEAANVLTVVLQYCAPGPPPTLHSLDIVVSTLEAARKYDITWAFRAAQEELERHTDSELKAVRVYAVACLYGLKPEATKAAFRCLRMPLYAIVYTHMKEWEVLSAEAFRRLVKYRQACQHAAIESIEDYHWVRKLPKRPWERDCCGVRVVYCGTKVQKWWKGYMETILRELESRPSAYVVTLEEMLTVFWESKPCKGCQSLPIAPFDNFITRLSAQISDAILQVGCLLL